eukprot:scaffold3803_cov151-Skeletonema_menzelii.AAC.8
MAVFYYATDGENWGNNTNWLTESDECTWYGAKCNDDDGSLEKLWLNNNQLTGTIPSEIGLMENLKQLKLYENQLTGTIPSEIGSMENLEELWLNNNQLTGTIPSEIGLMKNLKYLILHDNALTGTIPSEIGLMENLVLFFLHDNALTGAIPSEVCALRNNANPPGPLGNLFAGCSNEDIDGRMERVEKYIHTPVLDETEVNQTQFADKWDLLRVVVDLVHECGKKHSFPTPISSQRQIAYDEASSFVLKD